MTFFRHTHPPSMNSTHSLFPLFMLKLNCQSFDKKQTSKSLGGAQFPPKMFGLILASLPKRNLQTWNNYLPVQSKYAMHYYKSSSETFQHFMSPGSSMLTFVVCVCHSTLLFEGLKWTSTFLIVSSCSHCTLIWPVQPGISSKRRGSPCLLISHEPQMHTHTTKMCLCMCMRAHMQTRGYTEHTSEYRHTHSRTHTHNIDSSPWANEDQLL